MARPKNEQPEYKHHRGKDRGYVRFSPFYGQKQHYFPGRYNSKESRAAYLEFVRQWIDWQAREGDVAAVPKGMAPVLGLLRYYLPWAKEYYGSGLTEFVPIKAAAEALKDTHGSTLVKDYGPLALKETRQAMIDRGWSRKHINAQVNRVRRIFRWAISHELADASILANLKAVEPLREGRTTARETEPVKPVEWSVVEQILPHVSPQIAAMIRIHELTGMRSDELTSMRPCDIDRKNDVWIYRPLTHKTKRLGKSKLVCLGPRAQKLLAPYIPDEPEQFIFRPAVSLQEHYDRWWGTGEHPVRKTLRDRYTSASYQKAVCGGLEQYAKSLGHTRPRMPDEKRKVKLKSWLASIGLEYWNPHRLRHSRATIVREQFGIEGAEAVTGNSFDAAMIYAERSVQLAVRIARDLG